MSPVAPRMPTQGAIDRAAEVLARAAAAEIHRVEQRLDGQQAHLVRSDIYDELRGVTRLAGRCRESRIRRV